KIREMNLPAVASTANPASLYWLQRRFDLLEQQVRLGLQQARLSPSERARLHVSLVSAYIETGKIDKAEAELARVPAEAGDATEVLAFRSLLDAIQDRNLNDASDRLRRVLAREPGHLLYRSWLGLVLAK